MLAVTVYFIIGNPLQLTSRCRAADDAVNSGQLQDWDFAFAWLKFLIMIEKFMNNAHSIPISSTALTLLYKEMGSDSGSGSGDGGGDGSGSPDILAACTYVPDRPAALTPDLSTDGADVCLIDDLSRQEDEWWLWPKLGFQRLDYVSCLKEKDNAPPHRKVEFKIIDLRRPTKTSGDKMDLREADLGTFSSNSKLVIVIVISAIRNHHVRKQCSKLAEDLRPHDSLRKSNASKAYAAKSYKWPLVRAQIEAKLTLFSANALITHFAVFEMRRDEYELDSTRGSQKRRDAKHRYQLIQTTLYITWAITLYLKDVVFTHHEPTPREDISLMPPKILLPIHHVYTATLWISRAIIGTTSIPNAETLIADDESLDEYVVDDGSEQPYTQKFYLQLNQVMRVSVLAMRRKADWEIEVNSADIKRAGLKWHKLIYELSLKHTPRTLLCNSRSAEGQRETEYNLPRSPRLLAEPPVTLFKHQNWTAADSSDHRNRWSQALIMIDE
ncbi:hypothetical protein EAG_09120 [Camponotus floridanus]|uniref:Uncharacterized protein n=1 Tax=Camponotus floridanus TaxID=104421 RepID=E2AHC9_CAMFO|nr:hypothetical protein EAG_09120 [Camponotus floridanus]